MTLITNYFSQSRSKRSLLLSMCFILLSSIVFSQTTATKSYASPTSVTVDGCGTYCTSLPSVSFSAADFSVGACAITDVNVSITWAKTDGTCTSPATGLSRHFQTNFRIDGPTGNEILIQPNSYSGNATTPSRTTILDQAAASIIGGTNPVSGTFRPNGGNLNNFNGTSPFGTWVLQAGDTGTDDPLCIVGYSVTITVSTTDNVPPVPDVATLPDITAQCAVNLLATPSASDNCGIVSTTSNASLPITAQGTTVITWTYDDGNGNTSTQTQNVIINDDTDPTASCQNITVFLDGAGTASIVAADLDNGSTDNCSTVTLAASPTTFTCADVGANTVTLTVTDDSGNTSTCTSTVTVSDSIAPIASCQDITVFLDGSGTASIVAADLDNGSTDNCSTVTLAASTTAFTCAELGANAVTLTVTDGSGNSSTCTSTVTVSDSIAPIASCQDITVFLDGAGTSSIVAADLDNGSTDNCSTVTLTASPTSFTCADIGANTVTLTVTDASGNTSTCTSTVTVSDSTAPIASCQDITVFLDGAGTASIVAADLDNGSTDNCSTVTLAASTTAFTCAELGANTVTLTVTDGSGNSSTCTSTVTVSDSTAPIASCQDITVFLDGAGTASIVAADLDNGSTDNCSTVTLAASTMAFTCADLGANTVTLTVTDGSGNSSTCTSTVTVSDSIAPIASCQDITVFLDGAGTASIVAADLDNGSTDNCSTVTLAASTMAFNCADLGANTVTLTVTDGSGNTSTCTSTVTVSDSTAPIASCQDITVFLDGAGTASIVAADLDNGSTDNCSTVTLAASTTAFTCAELGANTVTLTVTDGSGNSSTCTSTVTVSDSIAPIASCQDITVFLDGAGTASIVASDLDNGSTDNCSTVTLAASTTAFTCAELGANTVTLTVTDGSGNSSTCTSTVTVSDTIVPLADVATLTDVIAECEVTSLTDPTATDNCGTVTVTNDATLPITNQGTTTVIWTYDDGNGNTSTQTQDVVITDITAPVADAIMLADVTAECEVTSLTDPTATDNCGGTVTVTNDATLPISTQGTTTVTWTYDDGNGNTSTQTQNVVITDATAPVADVAILTDVTAECEVSTLTDPTATDNCGGTVTVTNDATLPISTQGTTIVTWTFDDGNGNTSTQTQDVVITDATAPVADVAILADVTAECEVTTLTDPTATDNCGGTVTVTNDATLPISTQGTTTVTWTYDDGNGNTSIQTQDVVITDVTAPVADSVTLVDIIGDCQLTSLTDPTATDNCSGTVIVTNDAMLPLSGIGTTVVTWTYDDGNGNTSTQTQNVILGDFSSPLPDAAPLPDVTGECSVDVMPTAPTATDACAGIITGVTTATFPITTQGVTVISWTFDDGNGNIATQSQNIVVNDVSGPVGDAVTLTDLTGDCSIAAPTAPTATDNCAGTVTGTTTTVFPITAIGTTTIVWEFDDGNGNVTTQIQDAINSGVDASATLSADGATITANTAGATYEWINCDFNTIIAGETSQSFTPAANGNYSVIVTAGICSDTSTCFTVSTVGIGTLSITDMTVYPNPSLDGYFTVSYDGTIEVIEVLDMLGRTIILPIDLNSGIVNGSELANGRYIIRMKTNNGYAMSEIVIAN